MKNRIRFYFCFFRSTMPLTVLSGIAISLSRLYFYPVGQHVLEVISICIFVMPLGLVFDFLYKEMVQKDEYYFYYNQCIRKIELWGVSLFIWCILCQIINIIYLLCVNAWKLIVC